jgi:hypothetical protein
MSLEPLTCLPVAFAPVRNTCSLVPPDLQEDTVKTVLMQAELLCADWA